MGSSGAFTNVGDLPLTSRNRSATIPIVAKMAAGLRRIREARGWSQERLAAKAGIHRVYLTRLESARQDPRLSTVAKLAKALGVPVTKLLE